MNAFAVTGYAPPRRIALLIDADNVVHDKLAAMLEALARHGTVPVRRAYGDWGSETLQKGWKEKLHACAIRPIQQFSYTPRKNATDMALVIDAMELLYTQKPDAFCLVSSDADFTPLAMHLRAHGLDVYGFGARKTPAPFVHACTRFVFLEDLGEPEIKGDRVAGCAESAEPPAKAKPVAPTDRAAKPVVKPAPVPAAAPKKVLTKDATVLRTLLDAVTATAGADGWAPMALAGSFANRDAPINPRDYGMKNFPALFAASGLFEIVASEGGQRYVADKRNEKRAAQPAGVIAAAR
jgi:hypothetical protein